MMRSTAESVNDETMESVSRRLTVAAKKGDVEEVKRLLQHPLVNPSYVVGFDEKWGERAALMEVSYNGHAEVVRALLEDGRAAVAADDYVALRCAAGMGHVDVVSLFLKEERAAEGVRNNCVVPQCTARLR